MPLHSHAPENAGVLELYVFCTEVRSNITGRCVATFDTHNRALRALAVAEDPQRYVDWAPLLSHEDLAKVEVMRSHISERESDSDLQASVATTSGEGPTC